jgi:hypothetical protein
MPDLIPAPRITQSTAPAAIQGTPGVGVGIQLKHTLDATPKLSATDDFADLDDWVTVFGEPTITSGTLSGEGVVRYKNQALTDNHKITGTIGSLATGTTRLFICGDESAKRYYALEIERSAFTTTFSIIKGNAASSIETGVGLLSLLFGILSLVFSMFSLFSKEVTKFDTTTVTLAVSDDVSVWFDEANSTIRTYINDAATGCTLAVPRGEIPHGPGYRWCGVATEIDVFLLFSSVGPRFTSVAIEDV